jgi:hypothetical protein
VNQALQTRTPLLADDRCDRCGAQAYVRVMLASGSELLFCAHHARAYEDRLREIAVDFQDETDRLTAGNGPGAAPAPDDAR